jgi:hypothetical protein
MKITTAVFIKVMCIHKQNLILQFESNSIFLNISLRIFRILNETATPVGLLEIIVRNEFSSEIIIGGTSFLTVISWGTLGNHIF